MPDTPAKTPLDRSPITLAFLFYLVTFGGILSACLRPLATNELATVQSISLLVGIGVAIGSFGGLALGGIAFRSLQAAAIAAAVGVVVGAIAGGLALVQTNRFTELGFIAFGGSWILILVMCLSARFRGQSFVE
jgi:hypothetical protein